jgi:hypothetical protein
MRVDRALEKLRALLARRGVTSTAAALSAALANQAMVAAPAGMAASVTAAALAAGIVAGAGGSLGAWIAFMSTLKITLAVAGLALAVAIGGGGFEFKAGRESAAEVAAARRENAALSAKISELSRRVAAVSDEREALKRAVAAATTPAPTGGLGGRRGGGGGFGGGSGGAELNTPEALEAGRAFLAKHPEARRALESAQREAFERLAAPPFAVLRLSPEEQEALYGEYVRIWPRSLRVSGNRSSIGADRPQNSRELEPFVRELVGEERFKRYENSRGREFFIGEAIMQLTQALAGASAVHGVDSSLTPEQVAAFFQILERHSALTRVSPLMANSPVWTAAMPELARVLSAEQMLTLNLVRESGAANSRRF